MGNFTYENSGSATYLVYKANVDDEIDSMTLGMITNNKILGLAPAVFAQMDDIKYIKYNVSSKVSAKQFFEGQVNKKRLVGVFLGIVNAILSAEDYMIEISSIVFDLNYIFSDVSTCDTIVICLPFIQNEDNLDLLSFFKNIMFTTQFDQTENCDYVAKIINFLNNSTKLSVIDFKELLEKTLNNSSKKIYSQQSSSVSSSQESNTSSSIQYSATQQQPSVLQPAPNSQSISNVQPGMIQQREQSRSNQLLGQSVDVPAKKHEQQSVSPTQSYSNTDVSEVADEDRISFMYLMQHYNKENAAKYKAQKAAKKAKKGQSVPKAQKTDKQSQGSFVVPGAPVQTTTPASKRQTSSQHGFAIPGNHANNQAGFAIPGQQSVNQPSNTSSRQQLDGQRVQSQQAVSSTPQQQSGQQQQSPGYSQDVMPQGKPGNFGETTVLSSGGNIGETTVLGASSAEVQIKPHLIRMKNNERISLNKPVFRIGKERSYVDYFVSDNTAVSRSHANIITRDGQYFIVDTNSTNHTYVNGGMIQSNVETPLSHGAKIRLANEEFEFRLY